MCRIENESGKSTNIYVTNNLCQWALDFGHDFNALRDGSQSAVHQTTSH